MRTINQYLLEARGEYLEYEKSFRHSFPTLWNNLKGWIQAILPITTRRNKQEEELMADKYIGGNVKLEIRVISHSERSVSSVLGVDNVVSVQLLAIPIVNMLIQMFATIKRISKGGGLRSYKIDSNGKVIFKQKATMLMFISKGALMDLEPEERASLYLWWIFDWANVVDEIADSYFAKIPVIGMIIAIIISRKFVYRIDADVAQAGYGKALQSALKRSGLEVRGKESSLWLRWLDLINKLFTKIDNFVDIFLPITPGPSQRRRDNKLEELNEFEKGIVKKIDRVLAKSLKSTK